MEVGRRNANLARRQQCACLIQEIGSRLQTTQVVINASLYYMHHFYEIFTPETIKPIMVALASFYIACKTEDFSRKLSFLVRAAYDALRKQMPNENSDTFKRIVQNIHSLEATILMVIGFQTLEVKQPHAILINVIRENKFPKEISHMSYYVCTNILHLTTLVLRHSMEAIAATSLYIASKWHGSDIKCMNGEWYTLFSPKLTLEEIKNMADEFTLAFQACDTKIKDQLKYLLKSRGPGRLTREDPNAQQRKVVEHQRLEQTKNYRAEKRSHETPPSRNVQRLPGQIASQHSRSSTNVNDVSYRQQTRNGYGEPEHKSQRLDRGAFSPQQPRSFQIHDSAPRNVRHDGVSGLGCSQSQSALSRYGTGREGSGGPDVRWQGDSDGFQHSNGPTHRIQSDKCRDDSKSGTGGGTGGSQRYSGTIGSGPGRVMPSSRNLHKNDFNNLF